jgi:hypothetical protein
VAEKLTIFLRHHARPNAANFCSSRVRAPATFGLKRWSRTSFERKVSAVAMRDLPTERERLGNEPPKR